MGQIPDLDPSDLGDPGSGPLRSGDPQDLDPLDLRHPGSGPLRSGDPKIWTTQIWRSQGSGPLRSWISRDLDPSDPGFAIIWHIPGVPTLGIP